jgi:hypothetical protein
MGLEITVMIAMSLLKTRAHAASEVFKQNKLPPTDESQRRAPAREPRRGRPPAILGNVFALDVTGSMGAIPRLLATQQLPTL